MRLRPGFQSSDYKSAKLRVLSEKKRILEISQLLPALHVAPAFSCLELVDTTYHFLMDHPSNGSDVFILSKGHGAMAQYAVLETIGVMSNEEMLSICQPGSRFGGHPDRGNPGIIASTGSLGHGLPIALGIAKGAHEKNESSHIFLVMSDGEFMEGSVWESLLLAPTLGIFNVTILVDHNKSISRGKIPEMHPNFMPLKPKIEAFGWQVEEVNGHSVEEIVSAFRIKDKNMPLAIIGNTVKGKGISFMENEPIWAYRSPNKKEYELALHELTVLEKYYA
jgi:transketolase